MKRLIVLFLLLVSAHALANEASKDPLKQPPKQSPKRQLRVALFDKHPFAYKDGEEMKGFHYAVAEGIADRMGVKLEISLVPVRRAFELLRQKKVDIMIMTDQTQLEEMKTRKAFLLSANTLIFTRPDHKVVHSKKDLSGNVCRLAGGCTELNDVKDVRWSDLRSYEQCLDVLLLGRVDSVCGTVAFQAVMNKRKIQIDQVKTYSISEKAVYIHALPSIDEKLWKEIETTVQVSIKDGSVDYWAKKFFNP